MTIFDIGIYESGQGGEFRLKAGDIETISGLTNQVFLALFGGNLAQSTNEETEDLDIRNDYWGNEYLESEEYFNSEFEKTLMEVALNSNGLVKLENAIKEDLKYISTYADISISLKLIGVRKLKVEIFLQEPDSLSEKISFIWDGTKNEIIDNIVIQ